MPEVNPFDVLQELGITGCTGAEQVHGGWDTTIWRVTCDADAYALRLFRPGQDRWAQREAITMRAVADAGVQVPAIRAEGSWQNRAALLLTWCEGRTLMQEMRRRPWNIRALGYAMGKRQAELHRVSFAIPGDEPHGWITRMGPVDDGLRSRLLEVTCHPDRLLHLDYHPLNIMVTGRHIGCILDWTNAASGDPRADVARTWSILRLMPLGPGRPEPVTESARKLLAAGWLRGYQASAGPQPDMDIFKVWAGVAMVNDMQRNVDRPEIWIEQRHVDALQRRVDELRVQADLE